METSQGKERSRERESVDAFQIRASITVASFSKVFTP